MHTSTRHTLLALALAFTTSGSGAAIGDFSSTEAKGSAQLCPEPLTQACAGAIVEQATDGALLQTSATVAMSAANKALHPGVDFAALAEYNPAVFDLPVLKALAASNSTTGYLTNASTQAVQAYTFTGGATQTFTLTVLLDAVLTGQDNRVIGGITAYAEDYLSGTVIDGPGTIIGGPVSFSLSATGNSTKSISFTLDPGESVYLEAFLSASARSTRGASVADAFNTMTMEFADTTGLVLARPVPEGGTFSMLAAGLVALAGLAWRRTQQFRRS